MEDEAVRKMGVPDIPPRTTWIIPRLNALDTDDSLNSGDADALLNPHRTAYTAEFSG